MKAVFAVLALFCSVSIAQPIKPTRNETSVLVEVVWYENKRVVIDHCRSLGAWRGLPDRLVERHPAPGCAAFYLDSRRCVIHTLRPRTVDDRDRMENLGHEVLHCFLGEYHD